MNAQAQTDTPAPEAPPKTYPCNEQLRGRLLALRDSPGSEWSNGKIAKEVGYSETVFYRYLAKEGNIYPGDISRLEVKAAEFLRDQWLELDSSVDTIECEVARQIHDAIEDIRVAKRIGVIIGEPGIGKTRGIDLYCQSHERAIHFAARCWRNNQHSAEECLYAAANFTRLPGGNTTEALAHKMRGSSRPLLVDDAHKLTGPALQLFYDFRDEAGIPIGLFGDERLLAKLRADKQRLRRTGLVTYLKVKNPRPLIQHHIQSIIGPCNGEEKDLENLCAQIAKQAGHYGSVQMELALACRLHKGNPDWSWCESVRRAHTRLIRDYALVREEAQ